jgi:hypothetical protein
MPRVRHSRTGPIARTGREEEASDMGDRAQRARMLASPAVITAMLLGVRRAALARGPLCNALANIREQRLQTNRDVALHTRVNVPISVSR